MGSQQFCLKWNNHQMNLLTVFDQLLQNEAFVDVTIACDGQSLKAHKMVLSACSPYFQSLFIDNPCQHPIVILKDVRYDEIKCIIDFMYKGEVNVSQDQLSALLKTAETLKVKGLAEVTTSPSMVPHQQPSSSRPVTMESVITGNSPSAKRKRKSHSSVSAPSPASPNSNVAVNNSSAFHRSSSMDHSNVHLQDSSIHLATSAASKSIGSEEDGESLHTLPDCGHEDIAGSSKIDLNMVKEEKLDETPDNVDELLLEATPEHIEVEPSTGDGYNGCSQDQGGSVAQLATTRYGNAYSPSLPSTSGTSSVNCTYDGDDVLQVDDMFLGVEPQLLPNKRKDLDDELRMQIVEALTSGQSFKQVSAAFQVHYDTVRSIYRVYKKEGRVLKKRKGHRKETLTDEMIDEIRIWRNNDANLTVKQMAEMSSEKWQVQVSRNALTTKLKNIGCTINSKDHVVFPPV